MPRRHRETVNNFVYLARNGYYDETPCHRIIPEFVVQCGDPTGTGTGNPGYSIDDELPEAGEYVLGSLAMANSGPDTNGSQFFIIIGEQGEQLPPDYSLFGAGHRGLRHHRGRHGGRRHAGRRNAERAGGHPLGAHHPELTDPTDPAGPSRSRSDLGELPLGN